MLRSLLLIIFSFLSFSLLAQPDADKPILTKDQVFLDDLIVDGSICIGQDCVNGESFGFDTQRFKENNLRIHFNDTSNSASFPTNDWRIVINDSSNGGANYFGIEDSDAGRMPFRVEAGAPAHSLYVEDGGRVGFGTSTPVVEAHIVDGDSPTLRLEQDGSSGFTPQTWDLAGNETNFFVRDATNGSKLPFKIRPGAPDNSIYIDSDGDVGFGTASPGVKLHVMGDGIFTGELEAASDERLKSNIVPLTNAASVINSLSAVSYLMKTEEYAELNLPDRKQYGLLAQEVENVLPELVSNKITNPNNPSDKLKSINYMQLIPFLIQNSKEQNQEIERLNTELNDLKKELQEIKKLIKG